ncbi:MAG: cupredoxin domain-containing protein [Candidatus Levybacteria bacterium]|nr:cupredoxin domain-containing protein [Candidatus Levybacteria bacterium]
MQKGETKTFTVSGKSFSLTPNEIRVNKGDTVKITFTNTGGFHDFTLDEFNVKTPQIQSGQTADVEFVADKAGTYEFYCSVGNHRTQGMKGSLIVE